LVHPEQYLQKSTTVEKDDMGIGKDATASKSIRLGLALIRRLGKRKQNYLVMSQSQKQQRESSGANWQE
jgi:hypothetical protein